MKTKGRPKSKNIEDLRTPASRAKVEWKNKVYTFIDDSFKRAKTFKPQEYNKFK